ncbi:MAG: rhomboid family intramembrane serine protease [Solirubrobacterales bacterium]
MIPLRDNIPHDRFPIVTLVLVAINLAVFLFLQGPSFSLSGDDQVKTKPVAEYGLVSYRLTHPGKECELAFPDDPSKTEVVCQGTDAYSDARGDPVEQLDEPAAWLTLFTSMFMHAGWLHIGFNMLFLWIFGGNVEDAMGRVKYVLFYLLGGLAAAGLQVAVDTVATAPMIGASGAIAAVLGGYALLYPRARVLTLIFLLLIFLVEIPALILLGAWFVLQFLPALGQLAIGTEETGGGVAYFAHVGGFLFGLATIKLFARRRSRRYDEPQYPVY